MKNLKTWKFGTNNDELVELVLSGKKTATTSFEDDEIPKVGEKSILTFENEKKACIVETKKVIITKLKDVTPEMAYLEGEGDRSLDYYKKSHVAYFKKINSNFNEESEIVFEIFEVVEDLRKIRLKTAEKVVRANEEIFGSNKHNITEIDAGFNNDLFDIDGKFVVKICGNKKEAEFEKEANFYKENCESKYIPKLYKYDNSKTIIDSVYEIIEKIDGQSVYYYWYKMNESERENLIKDLISRIKQVHYKKKDGYNWAEKLKNQVKENFQKSEDLFSEKEKQIILKSLDLYNEILSDNKFVLIHNDLHFDNVLIDSKNQIKIIDFNDSMIAPFDYDFRLLYMCQDTPWKWANSEMDPYQRKEDYVNIFEYIKKYYNELNNVRYLEKRMIIYRIVNDIRLFARFKEEEEKNRIVEDSKKLLNQT